MVTLMESWLIMLAVLIVVALYRKWLARTEDDTVHLSDFEGRIVHHQATLAKQLERVEMAGKVITIAFVLYTLTLIGRIIYLGWMDSLQMK
jgi:phage terminase Nu1 subunit (DNA packaging protein)